jgi:hypothetical protein
VDVLEFVCLHRSNSERALMEYYIVRIYHREPCQIVGGDLRHVRISGLVEDCNGNKEPFHDAEALGRLLVEACSGTAQAGTRASIPPSD